MVHKRLPCFTIYRIPQTYVLNDYICVDAFPGKHLSIKGTLIELGLYDFMNQWIMLNEGQLTAYIYNS